MTGDGYHRFVSIARGSVAVETLVEVAQVIDIATPEDLENTVSLLQLIGRQLTSLRRALAN